MQEYTTVQNQAIYPVISEAPKGTAEEKISFQAITDNVILKYIPEEGQVMASQIVNEGLFWLVTDVLGMKEGTMQKWDPTSITLDQIKNKLDNLQNDTNDLLDADLKSALYWLESASIALKNENYEYSSSKLQKVVDNAVSAYHKIKDFRKKAFCMKIIIFSKRMIQCYSKDNQTFINLQSLPIEKQNELAADVISDVDKSLKEFEKIKESWWARMVNNAMKKSKEQDVLDQVLKAALPIIWYQNELFKAKNYDDKNMSKYLPDGEENAAEILLEGKWPMMIWKKNGLVEFDFQDKENYILEIIKGMYPSTCNILVLKNDMNFFCRAFSDFKSFKTKVFCTKVVICYRMLIQCYNSKTKSIDDFYSLPVFKQKDIAEDVLHDIEKILEEFEKDIGKQKELQVILNTILKTTLPIIWHHHEMFKVKSYKDKNFLTYLPEGKDDAAEILLAKKWPIRIWKNNGLVEFEFKEEQVDVLGMISSGSCGIVVLEELLVLADRAKSLSININIFYKEMAIIAKKYISCYNKETETFDNLSSLPLDKQNELAANVLSDVDMILKMAKKREEQVLLNGLLRTALPIIWNYHESFKLHDWLCKEVFQYLPDGKQDAVEVILEGKWPIRIWKELYIGIGAEGLRFEFQSKTAVDEGIRKTIYHSIASHYCCKYYKLICSKVKKNVDFIKLF